jgi:hypothetical protein
MHASGTFAVKISPAEASALAREAGPGCMTINKTFAGDIHGTSKGEMLTGGRRINRHDGLRCAGARDSQPCRPQRKLPIDA